MATYTANYGLHQWVPEDVFVRTDFNTDLSKIDTALQGLQDETDAKAELVTGSYSGNEASSRTISLGFQPQWVLVMMQNGRMDANCGGLVSRQMSSNALSVASTGFTVRYQASYGPYTNTPGQVYHYLAQR
ncbi:hypothetical protein [Pseudoflavonifractor phocaeensis]|uniref:hypothetical protein n=1 Tax=Pseudoflavonifractor phocaeensis TaxID=1870988 RepID=UPI00195ED364|nr:hypothetical protein [Pseudoflavonifractor phocaeensis]MBM6927182.1 hypothetical protein [Pseudoflavonifractor phocaeensis]